MKKLLTSLTARFSTQRKAQLEQGFTLVEVLTSVAITALMASGAVYMTEAILQSFASAQQTTQQIQKDEDLKTVLSIDLDRHTIQSFSAAGFSLRGTLDGADEILCVVVDYGITFTAPESLTDSPKAFFTRSTYYNAEPDCETSSTSDNPDWVKSQNSLSVYLGPADNIYTSYELTNAAGVELRITDSLPFFPTPPVISENYADDERVIHVMNDTTPRWLNIQVAGTAWHLKLSKQLQSY